MFTLCQGGGHSGGTYFRSWLEFEQFHAPLEDYTAYQRLGMAMRQRVQGFTEIHKLLAALSQLGVRSCPDVRVAIETRCAGALIMPRQGGDNG